MKMSRKLYDEVAGLCMALSGFHRGCMTVWFLVGNGRMDYGDYYWGLYTDYYSDA